MSTIGSATPSLICTSLFAFPKAAYHAPIQGVILRCPQRLSGLRGRHRRGRAGLRRLVDRINRTWPPPGAFGAVQLDIGYFANVIDIGGVGLAISTDGVGSTALIAQ